MTQHDKARELVEQGIAVLGPHDDMPECVQRNLMVYVNMWQFREMLDTITALAEKNRRLREALKKIASTGRCEFAEVRAVLRSTEASHD